MANQELQGKSYRVPPDVVKGIQSSLVTNPNAEGVKRAKNIVHEPNLTYEAMKRLKNFFDYFNPQTDDQTQYALSGGDAMKIFIERTLNQERAGVQRSKEVTRDATANPNSELQAFQSPRLNEEKKGLKQNAVAVIVNQDNKILLLKRSDFPDQWMPDKWALVGGGVEKKESAEEACKREIKEETGLEIDKFIESFKIQRHEDSEETIFACRYDGEPTDIELNEENDKYGWYDIGEMDYLDTVPHLVEYITMVFKKYD